MPKFFSNPFHRDPNTPQKKRVWGRCKTCHREGWAERTLYNDDEQTTYYTCLTHGCRDNFEEHPPSRDKEPDKPVRGLNERTGGVEHLDQSYVQGRDPLKGRKRYYQLPAFCRRCEKNVMANVEENLDNGYVYARCSDCGTKLGRRDMK